MSPRSTGKRKRPVDAWIRAVLSEHCDLPSSARLVAVALAQYMNFATLDNAYPGPARLAAETGLHHRTVQRQLCVLMKREWIEQTAKGGTTVSGEHLASTYRGIPRHEATDPTAACPAPHDTGSESPRRDATPTGHDPVIDRGHDRAAAPGGAGAAPAGRVRDRSTVSEFPADIAGVYDRAADGRLVKREETDQ